MRDGRKSTLPSLLNDYVDDPGVKIKSEKEQQQHHQKAKKKSGTRKSQTSHRSAHRKSGHRTPTPGDSRSARSRKSEGQRLERLADTWEQAKAEVLQDRHEKLNEKVVLQQALIKAQDCRAELIRQEEEEARIKKRDEERKQKQDKLAALQDQCKQSLDNDRKAKRKSKPKDADASSVGKPSVDGDGERYSETSSPVSGSVESGSQKRGSRRSGHTGYLPTDSYVPATSPMKELEDENEDGEEGAVKERAAEGVVTPADLNSVPWHHAQLYKMYGRNADYYIHPKMQPEKKKIVNPTLKSQKGHLGASHIWMTLRGDSMSKLHHTDKKFPNELKAAFGSHVREGITKHKQPVYRNFTETDDVPDIARLMDQSLLRRIRVLRHKTELMYRSSQINHDRTKILLFNNPLPAVSEGEEGIDRYLPSWNDADSTSTEATYTRWVKNRKHLKQIEPGNEGEEEDEENVCPAEGKGKHPMSVLSPVGSDVSEGLQAVWHSIMVRQRPRKEPKYHFLTEEETRSEGAFLAKLGVEKDKIDMGRTDLLHMLEGHRDVRMSLPSIKSQSALERGSIRNSLASVARNRSESATNSQSSRYESRWEPLSMNALVEYKEQLATEGCGEFQQGRPKMWNTVISQN